MLIVSLDPGVTTGIAVKRSDKTFFELITISEKKLNEMDLFEFLNAVDPDIIVYEDFIHTQVIKVNLTPAHLIGVVKQYSQFARIPAISSAPSNKAWWTNHKIKTIDLWEKGKPHGMDALRHLLFYETFKANNHYYIDQLKESMNK